MTDLQNACGLLGRVEKRLFLPDTSRSPQALPIWSAHDSAKRSAMATPGIELLPWTQGSATRWLIQWDAFERPMRAQAYVRTRARTSRASGPSPTRVVAEASVRREATSHSSEAGPLIVVKAGSSGR